jgi:membrane peptidoglycan carboxypeptidase
LHLETLAALRTAIDATTEELAGISPWDEPLLYNHTDFRRMMAIRYVTGLAAALGVDTALPPVLSLPLGAAEVSLLEIANVYQGFVAGRGFQIGGERYADSAVPGIRSRIVVPPGGAHQALIAEIRDVDGNVIYRVKPEAWQVARPADAALVGGILRNVVRWGTGRRAKLGLTLGQHTWPLAGKTGTTNGNRNAAFSGIVPVEKEGRIRWDAGLVIAAYVGYDDNRSMKRGTLRVSGASGALPAWTSTARGLAAAGLLGPGRAKGPSEPFYGDVGNQRTVDGAGFPHDAIEWGEDLPTLFTLVDEARSFSPYDPGPARIAPGVWTAIEAEG